MIYQLADKRPQLKGEGHFIADSADLIGDVTLEDSVSVWFGAVVRADNHPVVVGAGSNIQDGSVLHTDEGIALIIGEDVTVGHKAVLHGCRIGNNSLIGINAVILNNAVIGENCIVGACALVTEGMVIPDNSLVLGAPARVVRQLDDNSRDALRESARHYEGNGARFNRDLKPVGLEVASSCD